MQLKQIDKKYMTACVLSAAIVGLALISEYWMFIPIFFFFSFMLYLISRKPAENTVLILIFMYPLLPFNYGYDLGAPFPVIKLQRAELILLFCIWIVSRGIANIGRSLRSNPLILPTVCLCITLLLIAIANSGGFRAVNYTLSIIIEGCALSFVVYDYFREEKEVERLLRVIILSGVVIAIVGVIENIIGFNVYSYLPAYRDELQFSQTIQVRLDQFRVKASFLHAISYGATLSLIAGNCLIMSFDSRNIRSRYAYLVSIALLFISCYMTLSRGPIFMFIFIIAFILLFNSKKTLLVLVVLAAVISFQPLIKIGAIENIETMVQNTFGQSRSELSGSSMARLNQILIGMQYIKERPFFGYGFASINTLLDRSIDNYYLRFIINYGLVGMFALLAFLAIVYRKIIFLYVNSKTKLQQKYAVGMMACMLGVMLLWLTVSLEEYLYYIWIMIGISMRLYVNVMRQREYGFE